MSSASSSSSSSSSLSSSKADSAPHSHHPHHSPLPQDVKLEPLQVYLRIRAPISDSSSSTASSSSSTSSSSSSSLSFAVGAGGGGGAVEAIEKIDWNYDDTSIIEQQQSFEKRYNFSQCFGPKAYNRNVYSKICNPSLISKTLEGFNSSIITYGPQGSGKTWSLEGSKSDPGMIYLCLQDLIDRSVRVKVSERRLLAFKVSYLEIKDEEIFDLFSTIETTPPLLSKPLQLSNQDAHGLCRVENLTYHSVTRVEDLKVLMAKVQERRALSDVNPSYVVEDTSSNDTDEHISQDAWQIKANKLAVDENGVSPPLPSAIATSTAVPKGPPATVHRSDYIFEIRVESASLDLVLASSSKTSSSSSSSNPNARVNFIKFVDLSSNDNAITRVGIGSNRSMQAFNGVIDKLHQAVFRPPANSRTKTKIFVPYRDSKLTRLLRPCLGGNCITSILCTISPGLANRALSNAVINFGQSAKQLCNQIVVSHQTNALFDSIFGEEKDYDDSRIAFEEYEAHVRFELQKEKAKLDADNIKLITERNNIQMERAHIDAKEQRISSLTTSLDEKDSKLRQLYDALVEQQDHLQKSIQDLKQREGIMNTFDSNYKKRDASLNEYRQTIEIKNKELSLRDAKIIENEQRLIVKERELNESNSRLQALISKLASQQEVFDENEKLLNVRDLNLKKKEVELQSAEKEVLGRRKESDNYDLLLRDKEKRLALEQISLDARDELLKIHEDKLRQRELELEKRIIDCKQLDTSIRDKVNKYKISNTDLQIREKALKSKSENLERVESDLHCLEGELLVWEENLNKLHYKFMSLDKREKALLAQKERHKKVEEEFYRSKVSSLSMKQTQDMNELEQLIEQQLQTIIVCQSELEKNKEELLYRVKETSALSKLIEDRDSSISKLKNELMNASYREFAASFSDGSTSGTARDRALSLTANLRNINGLTSIFSEPLVEKPPENNYKTSRIGDSSEYSRVKLANFNSSSSFSQRIMESQQKLDAILNESILEGSLALSTSNNSNNNDKIRRNLSPFKSKSSLGSK